MYQKNIFEKDGSGIYTVSIADDIEKVNPIEYYKKSFIEMFVNDNRLILNLKNKNLSALISDDFLIKKAEEEWKEISYEFHSVSIPPSLIKLLETTKKSDQIKLLKLSSLSPQIMLNYTAFAFNSFGYLYSQYRFERYPKNIDLSKMPTLFVNESDIIKKVGDTEYNDGQLKNAIIQRKVIIANFLDLGEIWHCFFTTYDSLGRLESWQGGTPHYHYLSNSFGVSREEVITRMQNGNYIQSSIHIPFEDLDF